MKDDVIRGSRRRVSVAITSDLLAGAVVAIVTVAYALSFAALIFSGPLDFALGSGIAMVLVSSGVSAIIIALLGSFRTGIGAPDTPVIAVIASMAAAVAAVLAERNLPEPVIRDHVFLLIVIVTVLMGLGLLVIGWRRWSVWMRFVPYPVVGGFVAASGWFLTLGFIRVVTGTDVTLATLPVLLTGDRTTQLAAACGFALLIALVRLRLRSSLVMPGLLVLGIAIFHLLLTTSGIDLAEASAAGWMLPSLTAGVPWVPAFELPGVATIDWWVLAAEIPAAIAAFVVAATSILLNTSGLEVAKRTNAVLDRDFKASGTASLVSGALGGLPGNISLNRSMLNAKAGARSQLSGLVCGGICLVLAVAGTGFARYIPTPILGGIILYMGLSVLRSWLVETKRRMSLSDYLLIVTIFLLIVLRGYLEGAALGVVASCLFFAFNYSRIPVVRISQTRESCSSYVERSREESRFLIREGERIHVLKLQGYIFFGTSNRLVDHVQDLLHGARRDGKRRWLVLDFARVSGIDSSATISFVKLRFFAEEHDVILLFSGIDEAMTNPLKREGFFARDQQRTRRVDGLDAGLEIAEEGLLSDAGFETPEADDLVSWFEDELPDGEGARRLASYCERLDVVDGAYLCRQGDDADEVFFIASGRVSILFDPGTREPVRLRTMTGRTIIGEMGFYRTATRSASVRVDQSAVVYTLARQAFETMSREDIVALQALDTLVVRVLADRLTFANAEIAELQRI